MSYIGVCNGCKRDVHSTASKPTPVIYHAACDPSKAASEAPPPDVAGLVERIDDWAGVPSLPHGLALDLISARDALLRRSEGKP